MRARSVVVTGMVLALVALPSHAQQATDPDQGTTDDTPLVDDIPDVDEVTRELTQAVRSLEEIEAALEQAGRDIVAADRRLQEATTALVGLEEEVEAAERAVARAEADLRRATGQLELAREDLVAAEHEERSADELLQRRSIEVFKYGTGLQQQAMVATIVGASDWHEVAVASTTVGRVLEYDRLLLIAAATARLDATVARDQAEEARRAAVSAEQRALDEAADLRALVAEREQALVAVEAERRRRAAVIAALEADGEVVALLVTKLEEQLAIARSIEAPQDVVLADAEEPDPTAPPPAPEWANRLPAAGKPWAVPIEVAANANGVDPRLLAALVWTESHFQPAAVSHAGAIGLAQLMPSTAAWLGVDPWDPVQNLDGGARYLAMQFASFGSIELALAAYNAGPTAVARAGPGIPNILETQLYVTLVLQRYNTIAG